MTELEQRLTNALGKRAEQVENLTENMLRLGAHVTVLTNAYESANDSHNALVRDLDELFR